MISKREVQRALYSVYYHRYFDPAARPLKAEDWEKFRPISLPEAATILRADVDTPQPLPGRILANLRLLDAHRYHPDLIAPPPAMKISAEEALKWYGVVLTPPQEYLIFFTRVVNKLRTYSTKLVYATLGDKPEYTDLRDVPDDPLGELANIHPGFRVKEYDTSTGLYELRNYVCDIVSHCATNAMSAIWSIDVNRPFRNMLSVLDARNWDHCSAFVELATAQGPNPACPVNDPGPPPNPGTDWKDYFCERIGLGAFGGGLLTVSNQLYFTFTDKGQLVITTFSDKDATGAATKLDTTIEYDRGWVAAGYAPPDPGWTRIRGFKHLRFTLPYLRTVAVPLMEAWIREEVLTGTTCSL